MKKSLLALLVSSVLVIAGCEDGKMTQSVLEAEKHIVQLGNELKSTQDSLAKKEAEVAELSGVKEENDKLKAELEKAQQNQALQVEIVKLFDKTEVVKHNVDPKEEFSIKETEVRSFVSLPKTNFDWLNQLLINKIYDYNEEQGRTLKNPTEEQLKQYLEEGFQAAVESVKQEPLLGNEDRIDSYYEGRRNNIATFAMTFYNYLGGAHGMHLTQYINVDLDKQAEISLNDLVSEKNQAKLKEILWDSYASSRVDASGKYNGFGDKNDFRISSEFYFSSSGIVFVYPPYELGPYAEGDVEVHVSWHEANNLLNPDYQRGEKDGLFKREE